MDVQAEKAALDRSARALRLLFQDANDELQAEFARQVARGLEVRPDQVARSLNLGRLRDLAARLFSRLGAASEEAAQRAIQDAVIQATQAASRDVGKVFQVGASTPAAVAAASELAETVEDARRAILRYPDDAYRAAALQASSDVLLLGRTTQDAQRRAWQSVVNKAVPAFVDSAGRQWNTATYVEMATRTTTQRAWDAQHEDTYARAGLDLVTIVVGSGACKPCSDQAGKILRRDAGPTGDVEYEDRVHGGTVTVHVDRTLDEARSHGWRHPNCRCRVTAYIPGTPKPPPSTTYDPELEAAVQKQRSIEREIRKAKHEADISLSPAEADRARARVRALQARQREHVASDDRLSRNYRREQQNLGAKP